MAKKRSKSDPLDLQESWDDSMVDKLVGSELDMLLRNRGVQGKSMKKLNKKQLKYDYLLKETDMTLTHKEISNLKVKELLLELKLRGLDTTLAKKGDLVKRLIERKKEDFTKEPPRKKMKPNKRRKDARNEELWTVTYAPEEIIDEKTKLSYPHCEPKLVGVYSDEQGAYNRAIDLLLEDIKQKKTSQYDEAKKDIKDLKDDEYKKKLNIIMKHVDEVFVVGREPYVEIRPAKLNEDMQLKE